MVVILLNGAVIVDAGLMDTGDDPDERNKGQAKRNCSMF